MYSESAREKSGTFARAIKSERLYYKLWAVTSIRRWVVHTYIRIRTYITSCAGYISAKYIYSRAWWWNVRHTAPSARGRRPVIDPYGKRYPAPAGFGEGRPVPVVGWARNGRPADACVGPAGDDDPGFNSVSARTGGGARRQRAADGVVYSVRGGGEVDFYVCHEPHVLRW